MNDNDILDSVGGSLLNDLLSDLNDTSATKSNPNDDSDDLFALLEQELASTYADPSPAPGLGPPPGVGQLGGSSAGPMNSAAAFVVNQQPANIGVDADAWAQSLSQFGSMSIASDFLAADATAKKQEHVGEPSVPAQQSSGFIGKLFEEDEEYQLEEKVVFEGQQRKKADKPVDSKPPGIATKPAEPQPVAKEPEPAPVETAAPPPTTTAPPPPSMAMPPMGMPHMPPPMGMPPGVPPHGMPPMGMPPMGPGMPPMGMPPMGMPPMGMPPPQMMPQVPPGPGMMPGGQAPSAVKDHGAKQVLNNRDFPALGAEAEEGGRDVEPEVKEEPEDKPLIVASTAPAPVVRPIFNDANPNAPPIDGQKVATKLMPSRDLCYIVHSMIRPLQSLDAYNDDFYHWSVVNRGQQRARVGTPFYAANPNPVDKNVKAIAKEREDKFQDAIKTRAEAFATEKKSLGQMVKSNVKRPKALLKTPVLSKENAGETLPEDTADSKYKSEQQSSRVSLWKARVSIDKGYSAFLSLIELRRLLQSHSAAPGLVSELMVDVKANVDLMHSSLGIKMKADPKGGKKVEIDRKRLASTLSLPKGRVFCARAIEEGILPHPSACHVLPAALSCVFSWPTPAAEGEDRLLHSLTLLVQTPHPRIDPSILYQCLETLTSGVKDGSCDLATVTRSQMRMKLLHSILSVGKASCANSELSEGWSAKEKMLMEALGSL